MDSRKGATFLVAVALAAATLAALLVPSMECFDCSGSGRFYDQGCFMRPSDITVRPCPLCRGRGKMRVWDKMGMEFARLQYRWQHRR